MGRTTVEILLPFDSGGTVAILDVEVLDVEPGCWDTTVGDVSTVFGDVSTLFGDVSTLFDDTTGAEGTRNVFVTPFKLKLTG